MKRFAAVAIAVCMAVLAAAPASAATADRTRPKVRFTTANDTVLVASPAALPAEQAAELTQVRGTATDIGGRGIRKVTVTFCGNAWRQPNGSYGCGTVGPALVSPFSTRAASVGCTSKNRQRCVWTTPVPSSPGSYLVVATAEDLAGNRRSVGPIFITVL